MPSYFEYLLKVSLCLAIIFLFYAAVLKPMTYYTWHRYYLLIFSVLSFVFPFININVFVHEQQIENFLLLNKIPAIANNEITGKFIDDDKAFNSWQVISAVYVLVSSILFVRLFVQLLSIRRIKAKAICKQAGKVKFYHLPKPFLPFSFLNDIFINHNNYSESELEKIMEHELVHVQQKHTLDVLSAEIVCILHWFNPFAWLIKRAIRENLEFIADDISIRKDADRKSYQYLLLKVSGEAPFSVTNNLSFSSLKSRIQMMNRTKTGKIHLLKFALLVPIITILIWAFRNKQENYSGPLPQQNTRTKTYILSSLTYSIPDAKVEAVVKKEQNKCQLKTGEALNLELVYNERSRLKDLLERNGYNNIGKHAITFMIDTTLENSFSVQVNINLARNQLSDSKLQTNKADGKTGVPVDDTQRWADTANSITQGRSKAVSGSVTRGSLSFANSHYNSKLAAVK